MSVVSGGRARDRGGKLSPDLFELILPFVVNSTSASEVSFVFPETVGGPKQSSKFLLKLFAAVVSQIAHSRLGFPEEAFKAVDLGGQPPLRMVMLAPNNVDIESGKPKGKRLG
jgi:hypothetical protein